jgi:hypothetical protein
MVAEGQLKMTQNFEVVFNKGAEDKSPRGGTAHEPTLEFAHWLRSIQCNRNTGAHERAPRGTDAHSVHRQNLWSMGVCDVKL